MAMQIANPGVAKIERLAELIGLNKTATVEVAVGQLLAEAEASSGRRAAPSRSAALLAQLDRIADRNDAFDALDWDEHGLPR